jgi:hypothetical protein
MELREMNATSALNQVETGNRSSIRIPARIKTSRHPYIRRDDGENPSTELEFPVIHFRRDDCCHLEVVIIHT